LTTIRSIGWLIDRVGMWRFSLGGCSCQTPVGLNQALNELAAGQRTTRSEIVRRALMREVADAGVQIGEPEKVANHA